jgi:hypothetical protein
MKITVFIRLLLFRTITRFNKNYSGSNTMHIPADKNTKSSTITTDIPHIFDNRSSFPFTDTRPETIAQKQLQAMADQYSALQSFPVQKKENRTGLPDNLKSGIEQLSGHSMDDVRVHYDSGKPSQLQAHAYAQGMNIHIAPGQERLLPHEAWHVVQQKQGRVKPTIQLKNKVAINDDAALEREADVMGSKAVTQCFDNSTGAKTIIGSSAPKNIEVAQLEKKNKAKKKVPKKKTKKPVVKLKGKGTKKLKPPKKVVAPGSERYSGHDSTGNKKALIDVLNYRKGTLGKSLSIPEEQARTISIAKGQPETGLANVTPDMIRGTAICHKISDKSIRDKIEELFKAEVISKDTTNLDSYLIKLVNYINPAHATDETPAAGDYAKESKKKYDAANTACLNMLLVTAGAASRRTNAHTVGKNVANSPVNLFLGDSVTNSSIQEHFDQNTYDDVVGSDPPPTPRSTRAKPVNDLINLSFSATDLASGRTKKSSRPGDV